MILRVQITKRKEVTEEILRHKTLFSSLSFFHDPTLLSFLFVDSFHVT